MLYPFLFQPILKERVWGGRKLQEIYQKRLPPDVPIGESWEISDRPGDTSVIANGPLAGKDLHWLMQEHGEELLGKAKGGAKHFPLLVKILDAQEKLSLQVHPPAAKAAGLGGEPKTEMWYIADAAAGAELYVGLKRGVTRDDFERRVKDGTVAECFHRVGVKRGDVMFLPSGRVHALGAGLVIFEIQQNSDTTYRVFDWNRVGLDGKPRDLHIGESLASIDFDDFEPGLVRPRCQTAKDLTVCELVNDPIFKVSAVTAQNGASISVSDGGYRILGVVEGQVTVGDGTERVSANKGQFCLVPAGMDDCEVALERGTVMLLTESGK